jgi:hypothetical protein
VGPGARVAVVSIGGHFRVAQFIPQAAQALKFVAEKIHAIIASATPSENH